MHFVNPPDLIAPVAQYSHGIHVGDLVFVAGQVAIDIHGETIGPGDGEAQTEAVLEAIEAVLRDAGGSLRNVVSATIYLKSFDDYEAMNRAWKRAFGDHRPARAAVRADLVRDEWLVEIQAIAHLGT